MWSRKADGSRREGGRVEKKAAAWAHFDAGAVVGLSSYDLQGMHGMTWEAQRDEKPI